MEAVQATRRFVLGRIGGVLVLSPGPIGGHRRVLRIGRSLSDVPKDSMRAAVLLPAKTIEDRVYRQCPAPVNRLLRGSQPIGALGDGQALSEGD